MAAVRPGREPAQLGRGGGVKHQVALDEQGVVCVRVIGPSTPAEVTAVGDAMLVAFAQSSPCLVLIDLAQAKLNIDRGTRGALQPYASRLVWDRMAVFGVSHFNRMMFRIVLTVLGMAGKARFFDTEEGARAWLREAPAQSA